MGAWRGRPRENRNSNSFVTFFFVWSPFFSFPFLFTHSSIASPISPTSYYYEDLLLLLLLRLLFSCSSSHTPTTHSLIILPLLPCLPLYLFGSSHGPSLIASHLLIRCLPSSARFICLLHQLAYQIRPQVTPLSMHDVNLTLSCHTILLTLDASHWESLSVSFSKSVKGLRNLSVLCVRSSFLGLQVDASIDCLFASTFAFVMHSPFGNFELRCIYICCHLVEQSRMFWSW